MKIRSLLALGILAGGAGLASGQAINVDFDLYGGSSEVGGGAPSSAFAGAANQAGFWNAYPTDYASPYELLETNGFDSGVVIHANQQGLGGGGGWNNHANSGDYALLLNDGEEIATDFQYSLTGLANGHYLIYCYVVNPGGHFSQVDVTIPESIVHNPQHTEGVMPGNQFILGVTHTLHEVSVDSGTLEIQVSGGYPYAFIDGFQIVPVSEPATLLILTIPAGVVLLRKRRSTR